MWPSLVRTLGLCLRPLLLMVSGPGGGCGEAHVCVNLHFGAQLMHRKETESSEFLFGLCASTQAWFPEFGWAFAFISQPFLPCVPHFRSTQEPEECLLVAKIL